jgi:GTPase SAR1 family protein
MTKEEFHNLWTIIYPDTVPISHFFKDDYSDRWFRIHSLPKSKRYADNENEWKILLARQNEIITDLFGVDTSIFLVTGDYDLKDEEEISHLTDKEEVFKDYSFTRLDNIDLYKLGSDYYSERQIYRPAFAETVWKLDLHEKLLREIANDNIRGFFVSFDKDVIVAPYDGGVDFVLKDNSTKDFYKNKYKQWLSGLESGL